MKKVFGLIAGCFFSVLEVIGQTNKDQAPAKPSEQKEAKATRHLEKEMQQKQLSAKPEMLGEQVKKDEGTKPSSKKFSKKKKHYRASTAKKC